jgi:hypothetical protein
MLSIARYSMIEHLWLLESTGRWKPLHYYAKNFFAPIITSPFETGEGSVTVYLVSDQIEAFDGDLRVRLFKLDHMIPILDYKVPVRAVIIQLA